MITNPNLLVPPNPVLVVGGPHGGEYWDTRTAGALLLQAEGSYRKVPGAGLDAPTTYLWRPSLAVLLDELKPHGFFVTSGPVPTSVYFHRFVDAAVLVLRDTTAGWTVQGVDGDGEVLPLEAVPSAEALRAWLATALCAPAAVPA